LHLAREAPWYMMRLAGQAQHRRSRLNSNVRPRNSRNSTVAAPTPTRECHLLHVVTSLFLAAWSSTVVFLVLLVWLGIRSKRPGAATSRALRDWHSIYTWPIQLLKATVWQSQRERSIAKAARLAAAAALTGFILLGAISFLVAAQQ
jgi:hypothetical protein